MTMTEAESSPAPAGCCEVPDRERQHRRFVAFCLRNGLTCLVAVDRVPSDPTPTALDSPPPGEDKDEKEEEEHHDAEEEEQDEGEEAMPTESASPAPSHLASAALAVAVGQYQDPEDDDGLAHLTEHVLFMGSQRYPGENDYDQWFQRGAGHTNAYTDTQYTVFYGQLQASSSQSNSPSTAETSTEVEAPVDPATSTTEVWPGALDRMAQALAHPCLRLASLTREIQAVDSEHGKNLCQDAWRSHFLARQFWGGSLGSQDSSSSSSSSSTAQRHPHARYGAGSKATLWREESSPFAGTAEDPDAANTVAAVRLQRALQTLVQDYYVAPAMTLAVSAPSSQSLTELQDLICRSFGEIPARRSLVSEAAADQPPEPLFSTRYQADPNHPRGPQVPWRPPAVPPLPERTHLPLRLDWIPVQPQARTMELQWRLPETMYQHYTLKPTRLWAHVLGHEGPGSLCHVLRSSAGWIQTLSVDDGHGATCRGQFSVVSLHMELTEAGLHHWIELIRAVYLYLDLFRQALTEALSNPESSSSHALWLHQQVQELRQTSSAEFRFLPLARSAQTVSQWAVQMHHYPVEHYLSGPYLVHHQQPSASGGTQDGIEGTFSQEEQQELEMILALLKEHVTVHNMLVMIGVGPGPNETESAETAPQKDYEKDPYFGTQYKVSTISDESQARFLQSLPPPSSEGDATSLPWMYELALPPPNDMLTRDFTLLQLDMAPFEDSPEKVVAPRCLLNTPVARLWYLPGTVFETPKVEAMFCIQSDYQFGNAPRTAVLASLYAEILHEHGNAEFGYASQVAGLHFAYSPTRMSKAGLEIYVSGYSEKAQVLWKRILHTMQQFPQRLQPEEVERIREKLLQQNTEFLVSAPYQHAVHATDLCLEAPSQMVSVQESMAYLPLITFEDVLWYARQFLSQCHMEGFVHGNIRPEEALEWTQAFLNGWNPVQPWRYPPEQRVLQLPAGVDCIYAFGGWNSEQDDNNCVMNLYQIGAMGADLRLTAVLSLVHHLLKEPAFNQLRTEEQLGYIVHSSVKTNGLDVKSLVILVQSDAYDPIYVNERMEVFLVAFRERLVQISPSEFASNVDAVYRTLTEKSKNLSEESSRHWHSIKSQSYNFGRRQAIAQHLQTLDKLDVLRFFDRYLQKKSPYRRKLSVQIFGKGQKEKLSAADVLDQSSIRVGDAFEFASGRSHLPLPKPGSIDRFMLAVGGKS